MDLLKLTKDTLSLAPKKAVDASIKLSSILSLILCRHNSLHHAQPASILIFDGSAATSTPIEHISFMNAVFEAQRQRIKIDVISLTEGDDSVLLRQAASITSGYFLSITTDQPLLPLLFSLSLGSRMHQSESLLALSKQGGADFRGACFCHGKVIDMGFVCSVCLSGK